jgi:hypothetical protein
MEKWIKESNDLIDRSNNCIQKMENLLGLERPNIELRSGHRIIVGAYLFAPKYVRPRASSERENEQKGHDTVHCFMRRLRELCLSN